MPTITVRGRAKDAAALAILFCTGEEGVKFKPEVCSDAKRDQLIKMMEAHCNAKQIWTLERDQEIIGMLIYVNQSLPRFRWHEIRYVVVDPRFRGKGIGPTLVRRIQAMSKVGRLRAEARNEHSERMLMRCGFQPIDELTENGDSQPEGKFPVYSWTRPKRPKP